MCIEVRPSLCWSWFRTRTPKMTVSRYVIAGSLQVLPTQLLTTLSTGYCPKENVYNFGLRKPFYSKQMF